MTNANQIVDMYHYHTWANKTIIGRIQELPASVLHQEVNSSFPTIAHALSHIYAVDKSWYMVLTGISMPEAYQACIPLNTTPLETVEEYVRLYDELAQQFKEWILRHTDLEQTIVLDNPFAGVRTTRYSEILLHVVNHGTYHRGNISTMLRQLGHASVMNDYALFWYQESAEMPQ